MAKKVTTEAADAVKKAAKPAAKKAEKSEPKASVKKADTVKTVKQSTVKKELESKLSRHFGTLPENATSEQFYKASVLTVKDILTQKRHNFKTEVNRKEEKRVYYMCMEFLMGRSLKTNLGNLGLTEEYREALASYGVDLNDLFELEPDAGLGNGGLGRLAACYLDSLASLNYPATGFSICYEYGLFKQKIVDGMQVELPDIWLPGGEVWLVPRTDHTFHVRMGGHIKEKWDNGRLEIIYTDYDEIEAVPYDMMVSGADDGAARLRLWKARDIRNFDMSLFTQGQYTKALEESTNAEVISKVLYPSDNHAEGKLLRLSQQYFLSSASVQSIIYDHMKVYKTLDNLADKIAIHINDTHPALCIPELMRILIDDHCYSWEKAWDMVTRIFFYTNHTVMPEALETWNEDLFKLKLPRIYQIIKEINERFCREAWKVFPSDWGKISYMSIIANGQVRMANLSVIASGMVNGVSALHSDILKKTVFHDFYLMYPDRFTNVTNGIAHRRWLCYSNPRLTGLITDCIGDSFRTHPEDLNNLRRFENDKAVLDRLAEIKMANKVDFSNHLKAKTGMAIDPSSLFDVQIKRLHEYKRQLLNALNIIRTYLDIKENPNIDMVPQTYIFGAKAAPGYYMAKEIIKLLCFISKDIENDPIVREKLKVVFLEDYNVSIAEILVPAAEISEQISLAGKEASGTGCMKLMMNGALTIGTYDGANVEMVAETGDENMFIFGLRDDEVAALWMRGYNAQDYYVSSQRLREVIDYLAKGFAGESFANIRSYLVNPGHGIADPYMCLADFESYKHTHDRAMDVYRNKDEWNRMSLVNVAASGKFAADRAIEEYAQKIWHLNKIKM